MAASQRILLGHVKGEKGDKGDAATIRVEATNTVDSGTPASVIEGGTPTDRRLTFNIPRGMPGTGSGGGMNVRSTALPMVHRIPVNWPFAPSVVLGAMDTLGWSSGRGATGRVWYFTNHATEGIVDGWNRTRRSPNMSMEFEDWDYNAQATFIRYMWKQLPCPINFGTAGYRGNWCRHMNWVAVGESMTNPMWYKAMDYDGLVFTNSNRALWVYGRGYDSDRHLNVEAITLPGLANAAITGMWAGITTGLRVAGMPDARSRIWVIQNNRLYLCEVLHNSQQVRGRPPGETSGPHIEIEPGVHRRITSAADFPFNEITDPALPMTMSRVYAEGPYAAVWGYNAAQTNRLAFFDGTQWAELTVPFNWNSGTARISNVVLIFANGRLAVYDQQNGDYYTCDNPSAGPAAEFHLRYRTVANYCMTNGFNRGMPQWIPRGQSSTYVYCGFDGNSDDGGRCYIAPRGNTQNMSWPMELYCSTSRPDVIPSETAAQGYAYPWNTQVTYGNISDRNTLMLTASYQTPVWNPHVPVPATFAPSIPDKYTDGQYRRVPVFRTRDVRDPPADYYGRVLDTWIGIAQNVMP